MFATIYIMNTLPHGSTPQNSSFTCNTCGIKFVTADLQRRHMKSEWHRYNLKRRVAQLPSISSEVFAEKVLASQLATEDALEEDEFGFYVGKRKSKKHNRVLGTNNEGNDLDFDLRGRNIDTDRSEVRSLSATSLNSRLSEFSLGDSNHDNLSIADTGSELNFIDSDFTDIDTIPDEVFSGDSGSEISDFEDLEMIPITHCFFCGQNNKEIEVNIKHMFNKHGLYIPERTYLTDVTGLLTYLSEIISIDNECLVCGFEGKNLESIRQHLSSKGHSRIPYESKEERLCIAEFYNFDIDDDFAPKKKSNKKVVFAAEEDSKCNDNDKDIQDDEEENDGERDDHAINSNYSIVHVDKTGVELTLPTGSKIGHRSMARYYRQNIKLPSEPRESTKTVAIIDRRFAPGVTEVTKQEKQTRLLEQRAKNDYERKTKGRRVNFQAHFRDEILGT